MSRLHHRGSEHDGRQGVEIDYCPECRGVWLDRGELDKNIDALTASRSCRPAEPPPVYPAPRQGSYDSHHKRHDSHHEGQYVQGYHKMKSWLPELFD